MEIWKRNGRCNVYKYLSYILLLSLGSILGLCIIIIKIKIKIKRVRKEGLNHSVFFPKGCSSMLTKVCVVSYFKAFNRKYWLGKY